MNKEGKNDRKERIRPGLYDEKVRATVDYQSAV